MAQRVLNRSLQSPLILRGVQLKIQRLPSNFPGSVHTASWEQPLTGVLVMDNIPTVASRGHLTLFFENLTSGGELHKVYIDQDKQRAVIVFKDAEGLSYLLFFSCIGEG